MESISIRKITNPYLCEIYWLIVLVASKIKAYDIISIFRELILIISSFEVVVF